MCARTRRRRPRAFRRRRALRLGVPPAPRRRDVLPASLAGERGGPVLDLACGTGRLHAAAAARRSHGRRASIARPPMLARRRGAPARGWAPPLAGARCCCARTCGASRCRAALRLRHRRAFHSIQHLVDRRRAAALLRRRAAQRCVPGGWFAFDVFAPDAALPGARPRGRRSAAGRARFSAPGDRASATLHGELRLTGRRTLRHDRSTTSPSTRAARPRGAERRVGSATACSSPPRSRGCRQRGARVDRKLGRLRRPPARDLRDASNTSTSSCERRGTVAPSIAAARAADARHREKRRAKVFSVGKPFREFALTGFLPRYHGRGFRNTF